MKGIAPLNSLLLLLVLGSQASAQQPTLGSLIAGADYASYAERLIERTRREKPEIADRADELYKRLPGIIEQLEKEEAAPAKAVIDSPELDARMERWIVEKGANVGTEIRFATGRLKTAQLALEPIKALIEERQRKQQIIASVILLISDFLAERDRGSEEPEAEKNKSDRVGPSAARGSRGDLLRAMPGAAALSID
jgi:hypothetical protein